jgi:valyl-tRNA synthetase
VEFLQKQNFIEKTDESYTHSVAVCYKGGHDIEPTILPNWFVKVDSLKKPALEAVQNGEVKIYPKWREITYVRWMEEMKDWPISRQVVWGIRLPVWYNVDTHPNLQLSFLATNGSVVSGTAQELLASYTFEEIASGLQTLIAPKEASPIIALTKPDNRSLQETDTFDTWFSSGHWPLVTLGYPDSADFDYFYPTSVLETGWEIIRLWVSRMIMFGYYLAGTKPFSDVYLHGLVRAIDGRKMSKSLGNVINPEDYMQEYSVDALRMGLISGTANGKDFNFPHDKIIGYRNFITKIWNMGRFILSRIQHAEVPIGNATFDPQQLRLQEEDKQLLNALNQTIQAVDTALEKYRFADAAETIYHFMWHDIADTYIESTKNRTDPEIALFVLRHVYLESLKLLHPFMPFVTEKIYQVYRAEQLLPDVSTEYLIGAHWPNKTSS